jgi:hypothetical protein
MPVDAGTAATAAATARIARTAALTAALSASTAAATAGGKGHVREIADMHWHGLHRQADRSDWDDQKEFPTHFVLLPLPFRPMMTAPWV